jgi:predicted Zn-dependent protease
MSRLCTTLLVLFSLVALAIILPCAFARGPSGVILQPKNETEKQAADMMIQGSQLLREKQPYKAKQLLEKSVQIWPGMPHGWFNLGLCYSETGEFLKAIEAYKEAMRHDHSMTECLPNIASCYQLMNQPSQAIPWFEEYLRKEPHAKDAAQVAGMINALKHQTAIQIDSNPMAIDYVQSICPEGHMQRWPRNNVPIKIFISNGCDESGAHVHGFRDYYNEILVDSIEAWMKASAGHLAYQIVDNVADANIVCTWTDKTDFLKESGNAVEQGAARIAARPINDHEDMIGHVRVIVLICNVNGKGNISDDVLKMACLHEVGHALGLAGHSTNNRDVMFFSESPTVWASLTKRDKATIAKLYGDYPIQSPQYAMQPAQPVQWQQQQQYAQPQYPQQQYQQPQYAQPQYPQQQYQQPQWPAQ